jgi:hypothetical protein
MTYLGENNRRERGDEGDSESVPHGGERNNEREGCRKTTEKTVTGMRALLSSARSRSRKLLPTRFRGDGAWNAV